MHQTRHKGARSFFGGGSREEGRFAEGDAWRTCWTLHRVHKRGLTSKTRGACETAHASLGEIRVQGTQLPPHAIRALVARRTYGAVVRLPEGVVPVRARQRDGGVAGAVESGGALRAIAPAELRETNNMDGAGQRPGGPWRWSVRRAGDDGPQGRDGDSGGSPPPEPPPPPPQNDEMTTKTYSMRAPAIVIQSPGPVSQPVL